MGIHLPSLPSSILSRNRSPSFHRTLSKILSTQRCTSHSATLHDHLFLPTTGRWLWKESEKQKEHTQKFNVKALEHIVVNALDPRPCPAAVQLKKIAEGASNKVFLAIAGEQRVIVKIPDPIVQPKLVTASEVATLEFLRAELKLPVPQVLAWSDDSDNLIGCEYVIMEEAPGQALNTVWSDFSIEQKFAVVDEVLALQKRLITANHLFTGYGSLYFADDAARLGMSQHFPVSDASRFCIGPLADPHFLKSASSGSSVSCGPWYHAEEYLMAIIRSSQAQIALRSKDEPERASIRPFSFPVCPVSDTSSQTLSCMLEAISEVVPYIIPAKTQQSQPLLWHSDLHLGNIFVSPNGQITSIIDWQISSILPLFLGARTPTFIEVEPGARILELPERFAEIPDAERLDMWEKYRNSMLRQYYLADLKENATELAIILEDEQCTQIRREIETFSRISHTNEVDAILLRETLLRIQRAWSIFTHDRGGWPSCPVNIGDVELKKHQMDGRLYNKLQNVLKSRNVNVAGEGWVAVDEYEERREDLRNAIQEVIAFLNSDQELREFNCRLRLWDLTDWPTMW